MEHDEQHHDEESVAATLGISRADARRIRAQLMREGEHWRKSGRRIQLTRAGLDALIEEIAKTGPPRAQAPAGAPGDVREGDGSAPDEKLAQEAAQALLPIDVQAEPDGLTELEVVTVPRNPRILLAKTGAGEIVRVRVASNAHFLRGMRLRARHAAADLYNHEGRCPRFRGRW